MASSVVTGENLFFLDVFHVLNIFRPWISETPDIDCTEIPEEFVT